MASLQKVRVQGRTYWRIVESRRINGKPRAIPLLHLGTADALLNRLLASPEGSLTVQSFQHDDVAALKAMDGIEVATLQAIEDELTRKVVTELGIELDTLFYDPTNFFTYIASNNERSTLTQRGHSKQQAP